MQINVHGLTNSSTSDDTQTLQTLKKIVKKELETMMDNTVTTVRKEIGPVDEDLMRKVVKEEVQSGLEKIYPDRNRNCVDEMDTSRTRELQLKFMDEVSSKVLTGKAIESKGGTPIRVALLDETTGHDVHGRPEASAKVEILVLEARNECDRIIRDNDKKKPHFTKSQYVYLKDGTGVLSDVKLGHDSGWTKNCECRLGARIVENFHGVKVKEALSGSFMVRDSRSNLYNKHYPPVLSDELWVLEKIGKNGPTIKRLKHRKILKVQDFLFFHHIDPHGLEKIAQVRQNWKVTVNHALTCRIDDTKIRVYCSSSGESKKGVVFDVVGQLKGIIRDSNYVPANNLSTAEMTGQRSLLHSAFEHPEDVTSFEDETSLLHQFPLPSNEIADKDDSTSSPESLFSGLDDLFESFGGDHFDGGCNSLSDSFDLDHFDGHLFSGGSNSFSDSLGPETLSCQQSSTGTALAFIDQEALFPPDSVIPNNFNIQLKTGHEEQSARTNVAEHSDPEAVNMFEAPTGYRSKFLSMVFFLRKLASGCHRPNKMQKRF